MSISKLKTHFSIAALQGTDYPIDTAPKGSAILKKLRRPEAQKFYNPSAYKLVLDASSVDIRPPHPIYQFSIPVAWNDNPNNDRSWLLYFHSLIWLYALCYGIDNDPDLDVRAKFESDLHKIVMSFIRHLKNYPPVSLRGFWDDHVTAYRCSNLSYFYEAHLKSRLSADERDEYISAIQLHVDTLIKYINSGKWDDSNHLIFQFEGIGDAWLVFRDSMESADLAIETATETATRFIDSCFSEEGTTGEHASFYHGFLMHRVNSALEYFQGIGRPLPIDMEPRLKKAASFMWAMMPSWPNLPNFGDTQFDKAADLGNLKPFLESRWENDELRQWTQPELNIVPPTLTKYQQNGYYLIRNRRRVTDTDALYSMFLEKKTKGPHGHWDGSSFMAWRGGEAWMIDSGGPYKYGAPLRYKYFQNQRAHNTVMFNSDGEAFRSEVISSGDDPNFTWIQSISEFDTGHLWFRLFGHFGDHTIIVIDWVKRGSLYTPDALFHLAPHISVDVVGKNCRLNGRDSIATLSFASSAGIESAIDVMSNKEYLSIATIIDTQFVETPLIARTLKSDATPYMTVISFNGTEALSASVESDECIIRLTDQYDTYERIVPLQDRGRLEKFR